MSVPSSLLYPLDLTVLNFEEGDHDYHFHVEAPEPTTCESCGAIGELVRFGKADQGYRDVPIHTKRVTLWMVRRRYRCNACGGTFRPKLAEMDDKRYMTRRLVEYIEKAALTRTNSAVAAEIGIEEKTVRQIFNDFRLARDEELKFVTPRILGLDEVYMQKQYRCVMTNIEEQTLINLLPNRSLELVTHTLKNLPNRGNIEILSTDMYPNYVRAAAVAIPQAIPVVDKFHVVKMANETLEKVRKSFREDLEVGERRTLLHERRLMLMRRRDLTLLNQQTVKAWFERYPMLGAAYETKELFFELYEAEDYKQALEAWDAWKRRTPAGQEKFWKPVTDTVERWKGPIFNYFRLPEKVTNAFTESANRKLKDLHRDTRGMAFEAFRAKVLLAAQHKVVRKRVAKSSPFSGGGRYVGRVTSWNVEYEEEVLDYGTPLSTVLAILEGQDG